jgi:hypothetical protein
MELPVEIPGSFTGRMHSGGTILPVPLLIESSNPAVLPYRTWINMQQQDSAVRELSFLVLLGHKMNGLKTGRRGVVN